MKQFQKTAIAVSLVAILSFATSANAAVGYLRLDANVEASLSQGTIDLINSLPAKIKEEAILFLNEAKPVVDKTVYEYIAQIKGDMQEVIDYAGCTATGTGVSIIEHLAIKFLPFYEGTRLVSDYEKLVAKTPARFNKDTLATKFATDYSDVASVGWGTACAVKMTPDAHRTVTYNRTLVLEVNRLWATARDNNCKDAQSCIEQEISRVKLVVSKANPVDVQNVQAQQRVDEITIPAPLKLYETFRPQPYEQRLRQIYMIEADLAATKNNREASILVGGVAAKIDELSALIASAEASVPKGEPAVKTSLGSITNKNLDQEAFTKTLGDAVKLDKSFKATVEDLLKKSENANRKVAATRNQLQAELNRIAAEKAKAEEARYWRQNRRQVV